MTSAQYQRSLINAYLCSRLRVISDHVQPVSLQEQKQRQIRLEKLRAHSEVGWNELDVESRQWLKAYLNT